MRMTQIWLIAGGSIFGLLGLLHAVYTLADTRRPRRLTPDDPAVMEAMAATDVRLSRGGTTMWRAWLGFNFSHSLGAVLFSVLCITLGISLEQLVLPRAALLLPAVVGALYFWLAIRYWFVVPAVSTAAGTLCLVAAWLSY